MTPRLALSAGIPLALLAALAGCTSDPEPKSPLPRDPAVPAGAMRLVSFDSCAEALDKLKASAKQVVSPWGLGADYQRAFAGGRAEAATAMDSAAGAQAPQPHSGTNTHEAGVDEPDLVKTDGRRIVTIHQGVLHVVDPASRRVTSRLDLAAGRDDPRRWSTMNLLLHGDRALVLGSENWGGAVDFAGRIAPTGYATAELLLVDLAGAPRVLSKYQIDGSLVDARQVGATARIVTRSAPRLQFPQPEKASDAQRIAANRAVIDKATAADWFPRYTVTTGETTRKGQVDCASMSRPATYSGTSMVTLLSFDLAGTRGLSTGDPVGVVADGDTVYSNGTNLYVANDQRWRVMPWLESQNAAPKPEDEVTEIYRFDVSGAGAPRYAGAGSVRGWLVNQYAMSEWDGHLRVATTSGRTWGDKPKSSSTVYVLKVDSMAETSKITGLGKGERIYAVRFAGTTGYVVTFRQTDPLYTVDLSNPAKPRVAGELKITGYSAYLHPAEPGRVIGIGQEASTEGRTQGTQVSLFDVSNLDRPTRLAQHHIKNSSSEAEYDPHAFLYWPKDRLLVVPLMSHTTGTTETSALVLRVGDTGLTEVGRVAHAIDPNGGGYIRRSLVVGETLWTVSETGMLATALSTMDTQAWLKWEA
ncbi:beta-propeller domain-containing protein [Actinomycetes bacterium KLBMP 9797]